MSELHGRFGTEEGREQHIHQFSSFLTVLEQDPGQQWRKPV